MDRLKLIFVKTFVPQKLRAQLLYIGNCMFVILSNFHYFAFMVVGNLAQIRNQGSKHPKVVKPFVASPTDRRTKYL